MRFSVLVGVMVGAFAVPRPAAACLYTSDCPSGEMCCGSGECGASCSPTMCSMDTDCSSGDCCNGDTCGTCGSPCQTNTDCTGGECCGGDGHCSAAACVASCPTDVPVTCTDGSCCDTGHPTCCGSGTCSAFSDCSEPVPAPLFVGTEGSPGPPDWGCGVSGRREPLPVLAALGTALAALAGRRRRR